VHIDFVAAMPRNDMGKIDRRALREEIIRTRIRTGGSRAP
jgi:acyl-coenzyme A synthetase/AMP-(fatty) acid ligase